MDELHGQMEVAITIGVFLLVIGYAVFEAWMDNERIEAHERIDHIEGWVIRAIVTIFIWGVASFKIGYSAIPCAIGSAFLFSAVFRYCLNRMRGKDWRYVSPSNWYDGAFILIADIDEWHGLKMERLVHGTLYDEEEWYRDTIHRAGTIAYITEATITAACVLWVVLA
jgi:hypothetical protein